MTKSPSISEFLGFAHELADASGEVICKHFRQAPSVASKGEAFDPVTIADTKAEDILRDMISKRFPNHGILGEEGADKASGGGASLRWILDPIDGTRSFLMGLPLWGTLIALYDGDTPLLGMMNQPFTGERFEGSGEGSFHHRGGKRAPLKTRSCSTIGEAILGATDPAMFRGDEAVAFQRLATQVRMRRFGGDCYLYCALAAGWIDLVVESDLHYYDILPLIPIVQGAGGVMTDWNGSTLQGGGAVCASGNIQLHAKILELLAQ